MKRKNKCPFCGQLKLKKSSSCRKCFDKRIAKYGDGNGSWKTKCKDCGKKVGDYYSIRCLKCSLKHRTGKNNPNWKGGKKTQYLKDRTSRKYEVWRTNVFDRDNFTCHLCKDSGGGNLVAHHILSFKDYKNFRHKVENGITLCENCHRKLHSQKFNFWILDRWFQSLRYE